MIVGLRLVVGELVGFLALLPIPFFLDFAMVGVAVVAALDGFAVVAALDGLAVGEADGLAVVGLAVAAQMAGRLPGGSRPHSPAVLQQLYILDDCKVCTPFPRVLHAFSARHEWMIFPIPPLVPTDLQAVDPMHESLTYPT